MEYIGKTEQERLENVRYHTLATSILKKYSVELSYNEQYSIINGMSLFAHIKKDKSEQKFVLPVFKGKNEKERTENAVFVTLLQNVLQRFESSMTEDEVETIKVIIESKLEKSSI